MDNAKLISTLQSSMASTDVMYTQITDKLTTVTAGERVPPTRVSEIDRLADLYDRLLQIMVNTRLAVTKAYTRSSSSHIDIKTIPVIDAVKYNKEGLVSSSGIVGIDTRNGPVNISVSTAQLQKLASNSQGDIEVLVFIDAYNTWDLHPCTVYLGEVVNNDGTVPKSYGDIDEGANSRITSNNNSGVICVTGLAPLLPDEEGIMGAASKYSKEVSTIPVVPQLLSSRETPGGQSIGQSATFNTIVHADGVIQYCGIADVSGERLTWPHVEDMNWQDEPSYRLMGLNVSGSANLDDGAHRFKPMSIIPFISDSVDSSKYEEITTVSRYYSTTATYLTVTMYGVKYNAIPGLESASVGPGVYCAVIFMRTLTDGAGNIIYKEELPPNLDRYSFYFNHANFNTPSQSAGFRVDVCHMDLSAAMFDEFDQSGTLEVEIEAFIQPTFVQMGGYDYGTWNRLHAVCALASISQGVERFYGNGYISQHWPLDKVEILKVADSGKPVQFAISKAYDKIINVAVVEQDSNDVPVWKCMGGGVVPFLLDPGIYQNTNNRTTPWVSGQPRKLSITHATVLDRLYGPGEVAPMIGGFTADNSEPQVVMTSLYDRNTQGNTSRHSSYANQKIENPTSDPAVSAMMAAEGSINFIDSPKTGTGWKNNTIFTGYGTGFISTLPVDIIDMVALSTTAGGQLVVLTTNGTTKAIYVYKLNSDFTENAVSITPAIDTEISQQSYGFSKPMVTDIDHKAVVLLKATDGDVLLATNNGIDRVGFSAWFAPVEKIQRTFK